jgi:hypothetical protein
MQQNNNLNNIKEEENYKKLKIEIENIKKEVNIITNILDKNIFTNSLHRNAHLCRLQKLTKFTLFLIIADIILNIFRLF